MQGEMWLTSDSQAEKDMQPVAFNNMAGVGTPSRPTPSTGTSSTPAARRRVERHVARRGEHLGLLTGRRRREQERRRCSCSTSGSTTRTARQLLLARSLEPGLRAGVMTVDVATRDLPDHGRPN